MAKYALYTWYAWQMGRWVLRKESDSLTELADYAKQELSSCYKIVDSDGNVIKKVINTAGFRPGMVRPK